jgi:hypothetical protein
MSKQAHALDSYFGQRLVSTLPIRERRKSADELKAMPVETRLWYEIHHPLSEAEKLEQMQREDRDADYEATGEVDERDLLDNHPPADWGM